MPDKQSILPETMSFYYCEACRAVYPYSFWHWKFCSSPAHAFCLTHESALSKQAQDDLRSQLQEFAERLRSWTGPSGFGSPLYDAGMTAAYRETADAIERGLRGEKIVKQP